MKSLTPFLRVTLALSGLVGAIGCDLTEVTISSGDPVVVVQAVMRPDLSVQSVFVEQSLAGQAELSTGDTRIPINDAVVTVTNLTRRTIRCSGAIQFGLVGADVGRYESRQNCPLMEVGDNLELRVRTADGDRVFGTMKVPGIRNITVSRNGSPLPNGTERLEINRDTDTLNFDVERGSGRGLLVELQSIIGLVGFGGRTGFFVDTLSLRLFGNLSFDFDHEEDPLFRAGRFTTVSIGLMDDNFFRFVQTRNDPFTGRGFDNRLEGGLGVFGGADVRFFSVRSVGTIDDPREGVYYLSGMLGADEVDLTMELYMIENTADAEFSAFIAGTFPGQKDGLDTSLDGRFTGDMMEAFLDLSIAAPNVFTLRGSNTLGNSFEVNVSDRLGRTLGILQVTR